MIVHSECGNGFGLKFAYFEAVLVGDVCAFAGLGVLCVFELQDGQMSGSGSWDEVGDVREGRCREF